MSKTIRIGDLIAMKQAGEKIACLTAYDASFARLQEAAGIEVILVGDSLGMVLQGHDTTLKVSIADMIYHTRMVSNGCQRPLIISDMPFMSYTTPAQALGNAGRLIAEGGAHMVKLEGGESVLECVRRICENGIPVCGHLGLTPQSIHAIGGYRVQGRTTESAQQLQRDAQALVEAGISCLVLECVPAKLAATISRSVSIPVIGIGAGMDCDGQVLVAHDMLGMAGKQPSFSRNFLSTRDSIQAAFAAYVEAVKAGTFPDESNSFQ